jgi:hypothetical protein
MGVVIETFKKYPGGAGAHLNLESGGLIYSCRVYQSP